MYISFSLESRGGGGNNFLKYLLKTLSKEKLITHSVRRADIVLINSHHKFLSNILYRLLFPSKIFVHRLDGKLSLHRGSKLWDKLVVLQNKNIADFSIFQSNWSKHIWSNNIKDKKSFVILNSVDKDIFTEKKNSKLTNPVKIVFSSWSLNPNKGIDLAKKLNTYGEKFNFKVFHTGEKLVSIDEWLNEPTYTDQENLASQLRECDIFFSPTLDESCSNSILEAIAVGLPIIAKDSGGNRQVVSGAGELFMDIEDLIHKVIKIITNYDHYIAQIKELNSRNDTTRYYINVMNESIISKQYTKNRVREMFRLVPLLIYVAILELYLKLNYRFQILSKYNRRIKN